MLPHLWIIGNWKMHGDRLAHQARVEALRTVTPNPHIIISVAPPAVYLEGIATHLSKSPITISAQDVSRFIPDGAYTGEVSAKMLADIGVSYVLIGHSERRHHLHETEGNLEDKFNATLDAGLLPILCVGENDHQHQTDQTQSIISQQLHFLSHTKRKLAHVIVAYEPVWAIGTGVTASVQQIATTHLFIKNFILQKSANVASISVLYGGSVNAQNADAILKTTGVDGLLVGGASLCIEEFLAICLTAKRVVASWK